MKNKKNRKQNLMIAGEKRYVAGVIASILLPGTGIGSFLKARGAAMMMSDVILNKNDRAVSEAVYENMFAQMPSVAQDFGKKYEGVDEFLEDRGFYIPREDESTGES